MSTKTTNYELLKPGYDDYADIKDLNDNMDIIDQNLHNTEVEASLDAATKTLLTSLGWTEASYQKISSAIKKQIWFRCYLFRRRL